MLEQNISGILKEFERKWNGANVSLGCKDGRALPSQIVEEMLQDLESSITSLLDSIELECDKTIKFVDSSSGYTTRDAMTFWDGRKKTAEDIKSQINKMKE